MFFQEATPDTSGYMIAGFVITFLVMALYVASIYIRSRNLKQDMTILNELEEPAPKRQSVPPGGVSARPDNGRSPTPVTKKVKGNQP
jgi:hypothetical protein